MPQIGIDLGTTNSLITVFEDAGPRLINNALGGPLTPSVVHWDGTNLTCGAAAKSRLVTDPGNSVGLFKRTMGARKTYKLGRKKFTAEELSAVVLRSLKSDAESDLGCEVTEAVISVPAYFNEMQRRAVRSAARIAGLTPLRLINEPTAAALAYGLQDLEQEATLLVFDLGGGTFDVSILEVFEGVMEVKSSAGDAYLGGEDFTAKLADSFRVQHKLGTDAATESALTKAAEQMKHHLSGAHEATAQVRIGAQDLTLSVTRDQFEEMVTDLLMRLRRPVERAIHDAKLRIDDIDRVVMVGGATRMPVIRKMVSKLVRKLPEAGLDPDHVVALGAAVQAGLVGKNAALEDVVMTDVSAFTLGIETARQVGHNFKPGYFLPIIERNTVVPVSREQIVQTIEPGQTSIRMEIYQGEAPRVSSNILLAELDVKVPMNRTANESVAVRFSYDVSGLLAVDVTVLSNGQKQSIVIDALAGELTAEEVSSALKGLEKLKVHPRDMQENIALIARMEQCYAMAREFDRDQIQRQMAAFEQVMADQNLEEIARLRAELNSAMDAFEAGYVN